MKIHTEYECEVCGDSYDHAEGAQACEALGTVTNPESYVGLLWYSDDEPDKEVVLAVAETHPWKTNLHHTFFSCYACRDNGYGDSLGAHKRCGTESYSILKDNREWQPYFLARRVVRHKCPALLRMYEALRAAGLTPKTVDDKGDIVELTDEMVAALPDARYVQG